MRLSKGQLDNRRIEWLVMQQKYAEARKVVSLMRQL